MWVELGGWSVERSWKSYAGAFITNRIYISYLCCLPLPLCESTTLTFVLQASGDSYQYYGVPRNEVQGSY